VILVGHSMAGFLIARTAELFPQNVRKMIFLCAYAPQNGRTLVEMRQLSTRQPLLEAIRKSADGLSFTIDPAMAEEKFYHDCPPGVAAYANARLCPQAIKPQATKIELTDAYSGVEKHYIRCMDDHAIPTEHQVTMSSGWPDGTVHSLPSGHSPFFSMPQALTDLLITCAASR
jgi:pimeloyl-ACP methyl ester carboxylesterase